MLQTSYINIKFVILMLQFWNKTVTIALNIFLRLIVELRLMWIKNNKNTNNITKKLNIIYI